MRTPFYLLLFLALSACNSRSANEEQANTNDELWAALQPGWNEVRPGGSTLCSNGTPYAFYFRPGRRDKLLVFFQGGGACWNPANCDLQADPTYDPVVDSLDNPGLDQAAMLYGWQGIFNFENEANPFRDYSFLVVPYCTGDVHIGNRDTPYPKGDSTFTIHHRGYTNASAALSWLYERIGEPNTIFVTGASAGALASPVYASVLAGRYPQAKVINLADSAGAYQGETIEEIFELWGVADVLEKVDLEVVPPYQDFDQVMIAAARKHPNLMFSQYNAAYDEVQQFFLGALGERPDSVYAYLSGNLAEIEGAVSNFRSYVDTGRHHVILTRPEFYSTSGGGASFQQWISELAQGKEVKTLGCDPCK